MYRKVRLKLTLIVKEFIFVARFYRELMKRIQVRDNAESKVCNSLKCIIKKILWTIFDIYWSNSNLVKLTRLNRQSSGWRNILLLIRRCFWEMGQLFPVSHTETWNRPGIHSLSSWGLRFMTHFLLHSRQHSRKKRMTSSLSDLNNSSHCYFSRLCKSLMSTNRLLTVQKS